MASGLNRNYNAFLCFFIIGYLMFLCCTYSVYGGDENDKFYKQGRLYTVEGYRKGFTRISIGHDSLWYWSKFHNQQGAMDLGNVARIEIQKGTRAAQFALVGSGLALLISSVAVLPSDVDDSLKLSLISGITISSGLVNLAYGASIKKYSTVYKNPRFK